MNNQSTTISDLPFELLPEILKRLPVKYVVRCRCVQKSWYVLIKTPTFITLHTNHQKENTHDRPKYLFFKGFYSDLMTIRFDCTPCDEYCRIIRPPHLPHSTWVAQSHGLLCVTYMHLLEPINTFIHMWNPLVQKYITLPPSPISDIFGSSYLYALAFGFLPQFNDYVLVYLIQPHPRCHPSGVVKISVYSLNNRSWNTISQDYFFQGTIKKDHSVLVDGVAFWLGSKSEDRQILLCFDTKTHIMREILLPDWFETPCFGIHPFGQSIAYFVQDDTAHRVDMWVLQGNSINEFFWEKKMRVSLDECYGAEVLGLRNNGEPIVCSYLKFISYNLDSHEANDFFDSWDCWEDLYYDHDTVPPYSISPFVESLALLNLD